MATPAQFKTFFGTEARPVTNQELIDFKKNDPKGYGEVSALLDVELAKVGA